MSSNLVERWITESGGRLFDQLTGIDPSIPAVLNAVADEVVQYDPDLARCWEAEGIQPRLGTYLLRYVTPFYELLKAEQRDGVISLLTAELLSVCAWRAFDNCMDAHQSHRVSHLTSLLGFARLTDYSQRHCAPNGTGELQNHYRVMAEQALRETEEPVALEEIWKRCSVLLYPVESLARLNEASVTTFKNYINYCGVAHDVDDLIIDLAGGVLSLPVAWFRETNQYGRLSVRGIEALYLRAKDEVAPIKSYFASINAQQDLPLIYHLLHDLTSAAEGGA